MELSKNDTKMLQGLSVLAMVWLHLFDRNHTGLFTPLVYVFDVPLSFYIAQLSDFCVFGFAFCSGYGHMVQFNRPNYYKRRLKGLIPLLCNYWIIILFFTIISCLAGHGKEMPGNIGKLILNALTLENSYNGAWWYMFTYIVLVAISPWLLKAVEKVNPFLVLGLGFVIYCAAFYVRFHMSTSNWLLLKIGPFGMTLFEYLIGAECCKGKWFTKIHCIISNIVPPRVAISRIVAIGAILVLLYGHTKIVPSLFVAPLTGFIVMTIFHFWRKPEFIRRIFLFVGKHSTNIWLTHMFFYSVLFQNLVYIAKYPLMIFVFMMTITIAVSMLLQIIEVPVQKRFQRKTQRSCPS